MEFLLLYLLIGGAAYAIYAASSSSSPSYSTAPASGSSSTAQPASTTTNVLPSYVSIVSWLGKDVQGIDKTTPEANSVFMAMGELYANAVVVSSPADAANGKVAIQGTKFTAATAPTALPNSQLMSVAEAAVAPISSPNLVMSLKDFAALLQAVETKSTSIAPNTITIFGLDNAHVPDVATKGSDFVVVYNAGAPIAGKS